MSTNLQQVVAKSKVSTLDGDLKDIAEQMLRDKFGFEEEVVTKRSDPFPQDFPPFRGIDIDDVFFESNSRDRRGVGHRDLGEIRVRMEPWSRDKVAEMEIAYPSYEVIMTAFREMDRRNIRPREKELVMNPEFYHFLMRDRDVSVNYISFDRTDPSRGRTGVKDADGQLFGCQVYITPRVRHAILIAKF